MKASRPAACANVLIFLALAGAPLRADASLVPAALQVDRLPNGSSSNGNSILEPGETVAVEPAWQNTTAGPLTATGNASAFMGAGAPGLYTIPDGVASYGTIAAGQTASCVATGDCYRMAVGVPSTRPEMHWDATFGETTSIGLLKTWMVHIGDTFTDVPLSSSFYRFVEALVHNAITGGCATNLYCPGAPVTREQLAVFVLAAKEGRFFVPVACALYGEAFADVPATSPFCRWVEELARRGVVGGCGGGQYCPSAAVSREQMAVFMLSTKEGPAYTPPACVPGSPRFADVAASSPFCPWIEELARRGVVGGCGGNNYCPTAAVSREQMAVFVTATFGITAYGVAPHMYVVNSANDVNDGACSPAHCSFREALTAANATPSPGVREEIRFAIPGFGPHVIRPAGALPAVTEALVVDGYTQPGAMPNTQGFGSGLDSTLMVELDLSLAGALRVATSNTLLRGLAINRSSGDGIALDAANAVEGCFIGTDPTGAVHLSNTHNGISVALGQHGNRIGGTMPIQRNLISGNGGSGIAITSASNTVIQGNLIGTNRTGAADLGNGAYGVNIVAITHLANANNTVVGGLEEGAGNVISANAAAGLRTNGIVGASVAIVGNTRIQANFIGFTATGAAPLPNFVGVSVEQSGSWDTLIGGQTVAPAGNAISGQTYGIELQFGINGGPHRTHIQGNLIRDARYGIGGDPNPGGDITANVIGPNTLWGIVLRSGQIAIRANSISGHGELGIDLLPPGGPNPNDPGDPDNGPNRLQNYPVLTSAVSSGGATTVTGTLNSTPNTAFTIELFQSPAAHPTGFGEGALFRGAVAVTTDGAGNAPILFTIPTAVPVGQVITATATDGAGNTSEFSAARVVQ